eukprot:11197484-Lingulodinium_polyedra.AAC.1
MLREIASRGISLRVVIVCLFCFCRAALSDTFVRGGARRFLRPFRGGLRGVEKMCSATHKQRPIAGARG